MRILFLTDNFPPEVNAPASRTYEHCREWVRAGHSATILTCAPNFPAGKLFPGYANKLWQTEEVDGIRVVRVWTYIAANDGFVRRTLDYASFMITALLAAPFLTRPDVIIGTSPQFFAACAAYGVSVLRRRPFVFELRDLWPESIKAVGAMREGPVLRALERVEMLLYEKAARVVCVTEAFKRHLVARGIDAGKVEVVTNGVDLSRFRPRPKDIELIEQHRLAGRFVAGYIGTLGMAHQLETLLDAAEVLKSHPTGSSISIIFVGDGAAKQKLATTARQRHLDNVIFIDTVPKEQVARYWSLLDTCIIHLKKAALFSTVIPSKLFESMAMGVPVLLGVTGEAAEIVERHKVGVVFEPENSLMLADALIGLAQDTTLRSAYASAGPNAARCYDRQELAFDMLAILEKLAGATGEAYSPSRTPPSRQEPCEF